MVIIFKIIQFNIILYTFCYIYRISDYFMNRDFLLYFRFGYKFLTIKKGTRKDNRVEAYGNIILTFIISHF